MRALLRVRRASNHAINWRIFDLPKCSIVAIRENHNSSSESSSTVTESPKRENLPQIYEIEDENPEKVKVQVFQQFKKPKRVEDAIYTLEEASKPAFTGFSTTTFRYPALTAQHSDRDYQLKAVENEHTILSHFPEVTDFLIVGGGLVGSATAYYAKKIASRCADVVVVDKSPYTPNCISAICNGLISTQSKSQDVSRVAALSKELIRNLKNDVLVTKEDFARINYRPVTHLILWPGHEVDEVVSSIASQNDDGCYTEAKLPHELEATFPWLKVTGSDVALGSHGNQDEALVDPIALRNLYRTLAQAHGANFAVGEVIDFNTIYSRFHTEIHPLSAGAVVVRIPATGELKNLGFAKALLSLGHNTPFLEARAEMESYMREQTDDIHFLQPKLRIHFSFHSLMAPTINFPVITDTDGSILIKEDYLGNFKYYLNYEESEELSEIDHDIFLDADSDEPFPNLIHKNEMFENYFNDTIKPKLVRRIPSMEDAKFLLAYSGFESHNSHDGSPVVSIHPFHSTVLLSGGYGSRMMSFAPAAAASFTDIMLGDEEETFDMTNFYWNRVVKNRKVNEFSSLIQ